MTQKPTPILNEFPPLLLESLVWYGTSAGPSMQKYCCKNALGNPKAFFKNVMIQKGL